MEELKPMDLSMKKKKPSESDDDEDDGSSIPSPSRSFLKQPDSLKAASSSAYTRVVHNPYFRRSARGEASLVPPIRQTASIFKQPVTIIKNQDSYVKHDLKYGPQEKPRQLFWEKRLETLKACDANGEELGMGGGLPVGLLPVGPNVSEETLLQSLATALHMFNHPVIGQTAPLSALQENSAAFLNPEQPLAHAINVRDEDIQKQEEKVQQVRRKLEDAINETN